MWLSERKRKENAVAAGGRACAYESCTGVRTDGEVRWVTVCAPGGYIWKPKDDEQVITLGGEQEELIVAGVEVENSLELEAGDVGIRAGEGFVVLKKDGTIMIAGKRVEVSAEDVSVTAGVTELKGSTYINGSLYVNGQPYKPCICEQEV